jgi:hypothetical protein
VRTSLLALASTILVSKSLLHDRLGTVWPTGVTVRTTTSN